MAAITPLVHVHKAGSQQQLITCEPVRAGMVLAREQPLAHIPLLPSYVYGDYCWEMVDRCLADSDLLRTIKALKLEATEQLMDEQSFRVEAALVHKYKKSRSLVRELYFVIGTNNIGVLTEDQTVTGYGLYPLLSRSNHSCEPSAVLEPGYDVNELILRAKRDMQRGEEVSWSYFREAEFLSADYMTRNTALVNYFRFACWCSRCKSERPEELAGVKNVLGYFDHELAKLARELARTPGRLTHLLDTTPLEIHRAAAKKR